MIKLSVIFICIYVFYSQYQQRPLAFDTIISYLQQLPWYSLPLMIVLSLSSWMVESFKWRYVINDFYMLGFRESVIQNLTAQAASLVTPLRAGEFAMKSLFFTKSLRKKILSRSLANSASQMGITTFLGMVGTIFYIDTYQKIGDAVRYMLCAIIGCAVVVMFTLWVIKKWDTYMLTIKKWLGILAYSLLRYLFFASNWLLVLWLLDVELSFKTAIINVMVFYLVVSVLPVIQLFDIAVKWAVAAYIFNNIVLHTEVILIATTLVWLTNFVVPTTLGCILLPFQKLKTSTT